MTAKKVKTDTKTVVEAVITDGTNEKCIWILDTPCSETGIIEKKDWKAMFDGQIRIPICSDHFKQHKEIMLLHKNGYDVEEILNATPEWRKRECLTIVLSNIDTDDVKP